MIRFKEFTEDRREKLRAKLGAIGKQMGQTANNINQTIGKEPEKKMQKPTNSIFKSHPKYEKNEGTDAPKGPESYEAQYKRRLVKTTDPEHKEKGYNWRIKGKKDSSLTKKLYKTKPSQAEFNKQMKRIAGHEFG